MLFLPSSRSPRGGEEVPQNTTKEIIPLPKVALKEKVTAASGIAILNQIEI